MSIRVALAGNPNSGKTTLFNELTGSKQHVGNWPGVTVEQKIGTYKKDKNLEIVDLPGIYSLSPYSAEEIVARNYIVTQRPDVVIDIVDATNIERNLYLTLQVLETGIPTVVALNMMDEVELQGTKIDIPKLEKELGIRVVPIVARSKKGLDELMQATLEVARSSKEYIGLEVYSEKVVSYVENLTQKVEHENPLVQTWTAIKLLENDEIAIKALSEKVRKEVLEIIENADSDLGGDAEATIADERYKFIGKVVKLTVKKAHNGEKHIETKSDKIDKVLTNRILAIPVFVVVMYLMFALTFSENLFFIEGLPSPGVWLAGIVESIWGSLSGLLEGALVSAGASEWVLSLMISGIMDGVGAVVGFLPLILVLFLLLSFLEDSGYMARIAFVMDRIFRKFGLSGKSFIPLLMGFGCSVPALMASRTLDSEKDRKITMMITPFMSCGAKLPIYAMFAVTLFADRSATLIIFLIYMIGLIVAVISSLLLGKFVFKGETSSFVMELPQYRWPTFKSVIIHAWDKVKGFAIKAGTIILGSTILIWFLSSFNTKGMCEMDESFLASFGNAIKFIFAPLGFGNWRATVGVVTGWIAKENIVATFGVLFGASDALVEGVMEGTKALPGIADIFTKASAFSYMVFNLLCMPCFAAVGSIKREMASWKWTGITVAFQMVTAWVVSFIVYHIALLVF